MICTDLTGNIGDHLTRYAICRSVAEKNGYKWGINRVASHDYYNGQEQMGFLDIDYGETNNTPYGQLPAGITNIWEEKRIHYPEYDYYEFQPDIFNVLDNTKLVIYSGQNANYFDRERVKQYFQFKEEVSFQYDKILKDSGIELDENLCVMNARGGEYRGVQSLFLTSNYWQKAINLMLDKNPKMKFILITDDPQYYQSIFNISTCHFGIAGDYYVINHAKNLLLSNSAFAVFPAWTNQYNPYVIGPKHWARHNLGIWACSPMYTFGFNFMDREGNLFTAEECAKEQE